MSGANRSKTKSRVVDKKCVEIKKVKRSEVRGDSTDFR